MKEWYLTSKNPDVCSGYESDIINQYAESNFNDVLSTDFADTVILYNHDLSESQEIQVVLQGNTADTQLKTLERTVLASIGTLKAGMYLYFDEDYWLITGRPDDNKSYEKSTLQLCNWLLKWQNTKGDIIERYAVIQSASKYNDGEDGNKIIITGSDQFSVQIPLDEESINMPRDVQFFIDYNSLDPTVYQLTNPSNVLYYYKKGDGITNWIVKEVPYTPTTADLEYGVCNYRDMLSGNEEQPSNEDKFGLGIISNIIGSPIIKIEHSKTYSANFVDTDSNPISGVAFDWKINCDFPNQIETTLNGTDITILCNNDELVGEVFELQIVINGNVTSSMNITIKSIY